MQAWDQEEETIVSFLGHACDRTQSCACLSQQKVRQVYVAQYPHRKQHPTQQAQLPELAWDQVWPTARSRLLPGTVELAGWLDGVLSATSAGSSAMHQPVAAALVAAEHVQ